MSLYDPRNRKELFLRGVLDGDGDSLPNPQNREEIFLKAIAQHTADYYGAPLTASTVAGMTDQSRVYVYTGSEAGYTAGNWYYWNGAAWTSGGVYNSIALQTDKTLTIEDMAADAKATGDALNVIRSDISNIDNNFIYHLLNGFDVNNVVSGYYNSSGNIAADSNYRSSQTYAIVYPGTVYNCYYNSGLGQYTVAVWYDKDKTFISRNAGNGISFTAPAGAAFVRVSVPTVNIATTLFTEYAFTQYYSFGYDVKLRTERLPGVTALNPLYGKKLAVTGDSICYGEGYAGGYAKIIGINNNMTVQNIGVSGGTVVKKTGYFCISESIANMASDADYAIIEGGFNDAASGSPPPLGSIATGYNAVYDTTTFYGAFETMLRDLLIRFQGKKIGYIAVHQATNNYRVINDPATSYYWAARKCCEKWGIPFCDLNTLVPAFGYFTATNADMLAIRNAYTKSGDGIHPNEAGYTDFYVPKIESWLKTL